jgi:hypothetical protein
VAKIDGLQSKNIDFVLAFPEANWMYQSTWHCLLVSIQLMFLILIAADKFSSSTKVSMDSSKQDSIGSKKYERDSLLKTVFKVKSTFVRTALFLHMLMTVLSLIRT